MSPACIVCSPYLLLLTHLNMTSYLAQVPTGTFAQAEEVAAAALFLCSDEARNINGTDVRIDGGFTAR